MLLYALATVPFSLDTIATLPGVGTGGPCWWISGSELGGVSALNLGTSPAAPGVVGLGVERGGMCGERRGQDPAVTAGPDLHGGDVS